VSGSDPDAVGIFVIGAHRSGTSAITRVVNLLGASVCSGDDLLNGMPDNPKGHWESTSLMTFNDTLLQHLGHSWHQPPPTTYDVRAALDPYADEAVERFYSVHPTSGWVWKDPRNCLLLPFWADILGVKPVVVFEYRDPVSAAQSLSTRDDFTVEQGLVLWERYMRHAFKGVAGLPATLVHYDELISEPDACIQRVDDFLRTYGAVESAGADHGGITAFLDPGLRHHTTQRNGGPEQPMSDSQRAIYATLRRLTGTHGVFPTDIALPIEPMSNDQVLHSMVPRHQPVAAKALHFG
jgi:hypothetical protein